MSDSNQGGGKGNKIIDLLFSVRKKKAPKVAPVSVGQRSFEEEMRVATNAQQQEVVAINLALQGFDAAVLQVTEPVLRTAANAPRGGIETRRAEIANATSLDDRRGAAFAGPGLRKDIATATQDVTPFIEASARIADHRSAAKQLAGEAKDILDAMLEPGPLAGELAGLANDPSAGADAGGVEAAARGWEERARQLLARAGQARQAEVAVLDAQRIMLGAVDKALGDFDRAVTEIPEKVLRDAAGTPRPGLATRRDALANAAPLAERKQETAKGDDLLKDIASAAEGVVGFAEAAERIALHREAAVRLLGEAAKVLAAMHTAGELPGELPGLRTDPSLQADAGTIEAAAAGWEKAAGTFLERARSASESEAEKLGRQWAEGLDDRMGKAGKAFAANSVNRSRLEVLWAVAQDRAEAGNYAAAFKLWDEFEALSKAAPDLAQDTGRVEAGTEAIEAERAITVGLAKAQGLLAVELKAATDAAAAFGDPKPAAWAIETDRIAKTLNLARKDGQAKIEDAVAKAALAIEAQAKVVAELTAAKKTWEADWATYQAQRASLWSHNSILPPAILPVKERFDEMVRKANAANAMITPTAFPFAKASEALAKATERYAELVQLANRAGHYRAIRDKRAALLPGPTVVEANGQANAELGKARQALVDAEAAADLMNYEDAVVLLNAIPKHMDMVALIKKSAQTYTSNKVGWDGDISTWGALDPKFKTHFAGQLAEITKIRDEAKAAAEGGSPADPDKADFVRAGQILVGTRFVREAAKRVVDAVKLYVPKRELFDTRYTAANADPGKEGIEKFRLRIEADKIFLDDCAGRQEFAAAVKVLDLVLPLFAEQMQFKARYVTYAGKKKSTTEAIQLVRDRNTSGAATLELAAADQYVASAVTLASANDYDKAEADLVLALARANAGKALLEGLKTLAPSSGDTTQARVDAFPGKKSGVASKDTGGFFASLLATTDAPYQQAVDHLKDPPKPELALAAIESAEGILKDALIKIARKPSYDTNLGKAKTLKDTTLKAPLVNVDNCLDKEINDIAQAITRAENFAKSSTYDFGSADKELVGALIIGERAKEKSTVFKALKADRQVITNLLAYVGFHTVQPALSREKERLEKLQQEIDRQLAAFNFAAARTLTAEGKALKTPFEQLANNYLTVSQNWTNAKAGASVLDGHDICKPQRDTLTKLALQINAMIDTDHAFDAAIRLIHEYNWAVQEGERSIEGNKKYTDARKLHTDRLMPLARDQAALEPLFRDIDETIQRANDMAAVRQFEQAILEIAPLKDKLDELIRLIPLCRTYTTALGLTRPRVEAVENHARKDVVDPLLKLINTALAEALAKADRREYAAAELQLNQVLANCEAAILAADSYNPFAALAPDAVPDEQALRDAIAKVKEKITALQRLPGEQQLPGKVIEARDAIALAETQIATPPTAKQSIEKASAACGAAEIHNQQYIQIQQQMAAALKLVDDFTGGSHAQKGFVAGRMAATHATMATALSLMTARGAAEASRVLEEATKKFHADVLLADRRKAYAELRKTLEPNPGTPVLKELEGKPTRFAMAEDIEILRAKLAEAAAAADAATPDFDKAMAALRAAADAVARARVTDKVQGAGTPTVKEVGDVLAQPDGHKKLDAMMKQLDPKDRGDLLKAMMQARFGCELKVTGATTDAEAPNLQRYYEAMAKLPPKHTLKNDSLAIFDDDVTKGGSDYWSVNKGISMREGAARTSSGYHFGAESEVGGPIPDAYQPANQDMVQYFDWNTLHEVGHAVDEKHKFMDGHAGKDQTTYGGWIAYGRDVRAVATKVANEFDYDLAYTQAKLSGVANPPIPAVPTDTDPETWERQRIRVDHWVDSAQTGKNPWQSNSAAMALELKKAAGGPEIIHDSGNGMWYGYPSAERKKGITGYQFRSPAEWFSELYAAKYSEKLKPGHPASVWLEQLENA